MVFARSFFLIRTGGGRPGAPRSLQAVSSCVARSLSRERGGRGGMHRGLCDIMKRRPHDPTVVSYAPQESHFLTSQRAINKEIKILFQRKDMSVVSTFLDANLHTMTTSNLVTILYLAGKFDCPLNASQIMMIVDALQDKDDIFNVVDVSNSCFGLQCFHETDVGFLNLVTLLTGKIQGSTEAFNSQAMGNALYGLKNLSCKTKEVRSLLVVLRDRVEACRQEVHPAHIASALFGLRRMESQAWEVRSLIETLTRKVTGCSGVFKGQEVGNSLYGLQNMTSRSREVRQLLKSLCTKISENREELSAQQISNALYGMRGLRSEHAETKLLLNILRRKVDASRCIFDAQAIGNSLLGMRNMSSDHYEVRRLLSSLSKKIVNCNQHLSPLQLCSAVSGFRRLSNSERVVRDIIELITQRWKCRGLIGNPCDNHFKFSGLCSAVYGLRSMNSKDECVIELLSYIGNEMLNAMNVHNVQNRRVFGRDVAYALNGLRGMSYDCAEVRSIMSTLNLVLASSEAQPFATRDLCNALSIFRNMSCGNVEVRSLLSTLCERIVHDNKKLARDIHACHENNVPFRGVGSPIINSLSHSKMKPLEVMEVLNSFSLMDSDYPEVRRLLTLVLPFLWSSGVVINSSDDFVSMMSAIRNMKSTHTEVRSLLTYFTSVLECSTGDFASVDVVLRLLQNFNGMDISHCEVCNFFDVLILKVRSSTTSRLERGLSLSIEYPETEMAQQRHKRFEDCVAILGKSPLLDKSSNEIERLIATICEI